MASDEKGILFFSIARSASNLFVRAMLSEQDTARVSHCEYHFGIPILMLAEKLWDADIDAFTASEKADAWKVEAEAVSAVMHAFAKARDEASLRPVHNRNDDHLMSTIQHKILVDKEHVVFALRPELKYHKHPWQVDAGLAAAGNPVLEPVQLPFGGIDDDGSIPSEWTTSSTTNVTVFPDAFLSSVRPVFIIRHPRRVFPSFARLPGRTGNDDRHLSVPSLLWTRKLYEWYCAQDPRFIGESKPLIVDAADLIRSDTFRKALAVAMGIDPDLVISSWQAATEDELSKTPQMHKKMAKTLLDSSGLDQSKAEDGAETESLAKWKEEFGEEVALRIQKRIDDEQDHYEFLYSRRFIPAT